MTIKVDGTNGVLQAYDYQVLTTGFSYTFAAGTQVLLAVPAGTLATGTVTMPSTPADGMNITITSTQDITALTINANTGQSIIGGGAVSIGAGGSQTFVYRLANTTWYNQNDTAAPFNGVRAQVFTTVGANSFVVPGGVTALKVVCVGGGGAGGGGTLANIAGAGGGGGGIGVAYLTGVTPGTVTVTVGAGGTGGTGTGGAGTTTSFGAYCTATGGSGGTTYQNASNTNGSVAGAAGGSTTGMTIGYSGSTSNGGSASFPACSPSAVTGGSGGIPGGYNTTFGYVVTAGASRTTENGRFAGNTGTGYGGGGGGAAATQGSGSRAGGNGSQGFCLVEW